MSKKLAEILAANQDYLKVNNIEKAMGLNKTALVRMIARKDIPEKHQKVVFEWWKNWMVELIRPVISENNKPENKKKIDDERNPPDSQKEAHEQPMSFEEMMAAANDLFKTKTK
jgi:hypothetical protein